jgi:hypothetical protein
VARSDRIVRDQPIAKVMVCFMVLLKSLGSAVVQVMWYTHCNTLHGRNDAVVYTLVMIRYDHSPKVTC